MYKILIVVIFSNVFIVTKSKLCEENLEESCKLSYKASIQNDAEKCCGYYQKIECCKNFISSNDCVNKNQTINIKKICKNLELSLNRTVMCKNMPSVPEKCSPSRGTLPGWATGLIVVGLFVAFSVFVIVGVVIYRSKRKSVGHKQRDYEKY
jgi:hypothetical protein